MKWGPKSVAKICEAHGEKKVDPRKRKQVLAMLAAEGDKRVESFLFEQIFTQYVVECCGEKNVSSGWWFQLDYRNRPLYWFKLNALNTEWNPADQQVVKFLSAQGCVVVVINFNSKAKGFYARRLLGDQWGEEQELVEVLGQVLGRKSPLTSPREYLEINYGKQQLAIEAIDARLDDAALYYIALSRLLVNCYLYPWFRRQPMDVDACCLLGSQLRFVEFKRKYPTQSGEFGIDKRPHMDLIRWLESIGNPLYHVILCDPLRDKQRSPVHLLDENSRTAEHALWLGTILTAQNLSLRSYQTTGRDSGMLGGVRGQQGIKLEAFWLLGKGMIPIDLCAFIRDPSNLPRADMTVLHAAYEAAVKASRTRVV
jgi:hypothetical protein